jgi:HSP20 family protein
MTRNGEIEVKQKTNSSASVRDREFPDDAAVPRTDIVETADAYLLMLDMPGAARDDIAVSIEKDVLTVKAPVDSTHNVPGRMLVREFSGRGYVRSFNIGRGVDTKNVDASFTEGVLTVKLLKSEEVKPKEITIR